MAKVIVSAVAFVAASFVLPVSAQEGRDYSDRTRNRIALMATYVRAPSTLRILHVRGAGGTMEVRPALTEDISARESDRRYLAWAQRAG